MPSSYYSFKDVGSDAQGDKFSWCQMESMSITCEIYWISQINNISKLFLSFHYINKNEFCSAFICACI